MSLYRLHRITSFTAHASCIASSQRSGSSGSTSAVSMPCVTAQRACLALLRRPVLLREGRQSWGDSPSVRATFSLPPPPRPCKRAHVTATRFQATAILALRGSPRERRAKHRSRAKGRSGCGHYWFFVLSYRIVVQSIGHMLLYAKWCSHESSWCI